MSKTREFRLHAVLRWLPVAFLLIVSGCTGCELSQCPESPCPEGAYCADGVCYLESEGCSGCSSEEHCFRGGCVPNGTQCGDDESYCDPTFPIADGYHCIDWDGQSGDPPFCSAYCEAGGTCEEAQVCFGLQAGSGSSCDAPAECPGGELCVQGQCRTTACRPSECGGILLGDGTCQEKYGGNPQFPDGAKCQTLESGANYCLPAGRRQVGESCVDVDTASRTNEFTGTCQQGLTCVAGRCEVPCITEETCADRESCVGLMDERVAEGLGYCAEVCDPFTAEQCDGGTCLPINADEGRCSDAGAAQVGDRCTPGAGDCIQGTTCIEFGATGAGEARCQQLCDTSVAPASEDGTIDPEAQEARDETCPQSEIAPASLRILHLSETLGAVDVYRRGSDQPVAEDVSFESQFPPAADGDWVELEPAQYAYDILEAGAPSSDLPLAEVSVALGEGQGRTIAVGPPEPNSTESATSTVFGHASPDATAVQLRTINLLSDVDEIDVIAVEEGADVSDDAQRVTLAENLEFGEAASFAEVPAESVDVYVYPAGADASDPSNSLLVLSAIAVTADNEMYLRGTVDDTDFYDAGLPTLVGAPESPRELGDGEAFTCVALDGQAYGYCQQVCQRGAQDFGDEACTGESMGCAPREFLDRAEWLTVCRPVGELGPDEPCEPGVEAGECEEGLYCREYGNTAEHVQSSGVRGLCSPLCSTDPDDDTPLSCGAEESCQTLSFDQDFEVGRCGVECTPDASYSDPACPEGLESCLPVSSLEGEPGGQGQSSPDVTREQSYCSQSGDIGPGQQCFGFDCAPGSECMYARSQQGDLVSTLVSQYYSGGGSTPTCRRQCDPFDGDSSEYECESGETCLFNFPWSAEVGHCADVVEDLDPGDPCESPGLSCGEDSICVVDGEVPTCFRFCDYLGPDARGALGPSTCPSGYECTPFVRDVGICSRPQ